jgi:hypothetical protein
VADRTERLAADAKAAWKAAAEPEVARKAVAEAEAAREAVSVSLKNVDVRLHRV